jgi:hypothetical protein
MQDSNDGLEKLTGGGIFFISELFILRLTEEILQYN